ncbi:MAG: hypothetical protein HQ518_00735 [Rhodopirellula sp.]|nr:hypothetical protein [Rhodopirellula sp.]
MKTHFAFRVIAVLTTLVLFPTMLSGTTSADEMPRFSRRLPDSVAAHLAIPDASVLRERLPKCSWGRLLNDPLVADFRDNLTSQLRAFIDSSLQLPAGVTADDLLKLEAGEITLTVLKPVDGKLPVVFSLDASRAGDTITALVQESIAGSVKDGWKQTTVEHVGTVMTVLTRDEDSGSDSSTSILAVFLRDGHVVASNSVDILKLVLDRWSGTVQGSFAANATLGQVQRDTLETDREPAIFWYLDPVGATISLLSQGAASNPTAALALSRLPKLGLTSFRGVGGTIDFATGKYDTVTRIAGVVDQPVSAAMALVQFPPIKLTPPAWVPNDIDSCMMLNWDVQTAYSGAEQIADELLGPGGLANAISVLSTKTNPPIHMKNDVLDGFTGEVMILQGRAATSAKKKGATLLAINLKDPKKFEGFVRQLIDQPGSKAGTRTIGATTVAVFDGKKTTTYLTVAHGVLLVGNDDVLMDQVVNSAGGDHLVESAQYRSLSENIPEKISLFSIQRPVNQLEAAYDILKTGGVSVAAGVDLKLLPTFDRIQHHFPPTATWAAPTADGFQYVSFSLPPAK